MAVYNDKQPVEKIQMANNFINFLISPQTQADIGAYGVDKYGKSLFIPMSVSVPTAPAGWVGDYSTPATDLDTGSGGNHCPGSNSNNLIIFLFFQVVRQKVEGRQMPPFSLSGSDEPLQPEGGEEFVRNLRLLTDSSSSRFL